MSSHKFIQALKQFNFMEVILKNSKLESCPVLEFGKQVSHEVQETWKASLPSKIIHEETEHTEQSISISLQTDRAFTNIQKERKLFWTKINGCNPKKYDFTESDNGKSSLLNFKPKNLEAELTIESLEVLKPNAYKLTLFKESALLSILDAGFDDDTEFVIHPKLAPTKIRLLYDSHPDTKDLARLIELQLQKSQITCTKSSLHDAHSRNSPFDLLIENETLTDGLLKLRCQKTRLAETIHVSDLPSYLVEIINSQVD